MPDIFNGLFELVGAAAILYNCRSVVADGEVKGVRWYTTAFFAGWGWWNTYYYASLDQWFSWGAGIVMVLASSYWVYLLYTYEKREG